MNVNDQIRRLAQLSIGRACLFSLVAVVAMMIYLIAKPDLALHAGAILLLVISAVLVLRAVQAPTRSYRETQVWAMLGKRHDLPEFRAQAVFGEVLRSTYLRYARIAIAASFLLWVAEQGLTLTALAHP